ncbi:hypothetical protein Gbem_2010 [Citrifermentans bemidjiense Bem]|uniref:Uncharacterized protein n=1 Tax=Citrifermentans bemidjiense (strain ATCC BAA-1014 / DSM 16622 / JCM 12645 / Bem) TaxID=404380 RepID=B5EBZ9_CITBB|nr:hypothetical protein [Citrifermentans bemidjiense]ACH39023.1 hypothetical protein Gbem_2010 [Citrifermentans bemidjiense Bem]
MGKVALFVSAVVLSAGTAFAAELPPVLTAPQISAVITAVTPDKTEICNATSAEKDEIGRRGCCSWHGGVCGCSGGSVVCCDGSYSPSCTCHHDDQPTQL